MKVANSECMFFHEYVLEGSGFHVVPNLYPSVYSPEKLIVFLADEEKLARISIEFWNERELIKVSSDYGLTIKQLESITRYAKRTANEIEWEEETK